MPPTPITPNHTQRKNLNHFQSIPKLRIPKHSNSQDASAPTLQPDQGTAAWIAQVVDEYESGKMPVCSSSSGDYDMGASHDSSLGSSADKPHVAMSVASCSSRPSVIPMSVEQSPVEAEDAHEITRPIFPRVPLFQLPEPEPTAKAKAKAKAKGKQVLAAPRRKGAEPQSSSPMDRPSGSAKAKAKAKAEPLPATPYSKATEPQPPPQPTTTPERLKKRMHPLPKANCNEVEFAGPKYKWYVQQGRSIAASRNITYNDAFQRSHGMQVAKGHFQKFCVYLQGGIPSLSCSACQTLVGEPSGSGTDRREAEAQPDDLASATSHESFQATPRNKRRKRRHSDHDGFDLKVFLHLHRPGQYEHVGVFDGVNRHRCLVCKSVFDTYNLKGRFCIDKHESGSSHWARVKAMEAERAGKPEVKVCIGADASALGEEHKLEFAKVSGDQG